LINPFGVYHYNAPNATAECAHCEPALGLRHRETRCTYAGASPAFAEIFPTRVRYTALSIGYNIAVAIFGGFAPFIATFLARVTDNSHAPGRLCQWFILKYLELFAEDLVDHANLLFIKKISRVQIISENPLFSVRKLRAIFDP
jgi:hypothetical protein